MLFVVLLAILMTYIYLAKRFNITDKPNNRSSHYKITVRGGGIIFPVGALIWFAYSGFQHPLFFLGLILISLVSFLDDIFQLSNRIRLTVQFGSIILLFLNIEIEQFPWWIVIIALIISTGVLNTYNFMDGINGITGAYSFSVLSGLWLVNSFQEKFISNEFIYFTAISLLVFSVFNFRQKAICFAGDVGSISIAFIIVFLLALLIKQTGNLLYILFLSIYGIDSISTIIIRISQKENIFEAHRKHLYQLLANELKIPHLLIATIYSVIQLLICFAVYVIINRKSEGSSVWLIGCGILGVVVLLFLFSRSQINKKLVHAK